jgi:hypothetical protein
VTTNDIERILASEKPLHPSSGFVASVMDEVREAAAALPPLPFPWRVFALGVLLVSASTGVLGWILVTWRSAGALQAALAGTLAGLESPLLLRLLGTLLGTYVLVALTLRLTGARP